MSNYAYDIAISFAGAQRAQAKAIAERLHEHDVKVFFDEYETASMWGADLNEHLTEVYQHQARYCLMLISAAYAERVWTSVERRSAQTRAIKEKGAYILPVRFDDTLLPGMNDTVAYVNFADQGIQGIANLVLAKLRPATAPLPPHDKPHAVKKCSKSPLLFLRSERHRTDAWLPVQTATWSEDGVTIAVIPPDDTDTAFLQELATSNDELLLAYGHQAAVARLRDHHVTTTSADDVWTLKFYRVQRDFGAGMEINFEDCTADEIAQRRADRLLLNKDLPRKTNDLNHQMIEHAIRSNSSSPLEVQGSPLLPLYEAFSDRPDWFLQTAWITLAGMLRLTGTIATITNLDLTLDGTSLIVDFSGRRTKQYSNRPATTITVSGTVSLTPSSRRTKG